MPSTDIAQQICTFADQLLRLGTSTPQQLGSALSQALTAFIEWPYLAGPVSIQELEGTANGFFPAAVYTAASNEPDNNIPSVDARRIACVFHAVSSLTIEDLKSGYEHVGALKRLDTRSPQSPGYPLNYPLNDTPLGVIFSLTAESSLEQIGEMLVEINRSYKSTEWPDMIVVLDKGTLNYAIQIEGDQIKGDFLLPNKNDIPVMPMYVHVFARGLGPLSLNRLFSFVFLHLEIFSPGVKLPHKAALEGVSNMGMTLGAYQFNLQGQLVPVPDSMLREKGADLRNLPFRIETQQGRLLSHVQFIPWQEGGAIRILGKMPLESVLVFLGPVMKQAKVIQQPGARISSVLPISRQDFLQALDRLHRQSNMVVKPEQPSWTVSKFADEGTTSPFMARLFMGVLGIRDHVYAPGKDRDRFDKAYDIALNALSDARATAKEIRRLMDEHRSNVSSGLAARLQGKAIHVDGIDRQLRKAVADFVVSAGRSLKNGMQSVARVLGLDIGFLFKDSKQFEKALSKLSDNQKELADYLRGAREWTEKLNLLRNGIEHEGWIVPRVLYFEKAGAVEMIEPEVEGVRVSEFVDAMLDRLCCFVEEITIYGLRINMDSMFSVSEIPLEQRDPSAPERFRPALAVGGATVWKLRYHVSAFEEV